MRTQFHPMLITALLAGAALSAFSQSAVTVNISGLCSFPAQSWTMQENAIQSGQSIKTTVTVSATKTLDVCSPRIYQAVVNGQLYSTVTFTAPGAANAMLTLSGVIIAQTQLNETAPAGLPTETLSFLFQNFATQDSAPASAQWGGKFGPGTTLTLYDIGCNAAVTAWSIGAAGTTNPGSAGGAASSAPKLSTLQITKPFDACSQQIVQSITNRKPLSKASLTQVDPATGTTVTITVQGTTTGPLTGITSYQMAGVASNSGQPLEVIEITYTRITFEVRSNGSPQGTVVANYDELIQH